MAHVKGYTRKGKRVRGYERLRGPSRTNPVRRYVFDEARHWSRLKPSYAGVHTSLQIAGDMYGAHGYQRPYGSRGAVSDLLNAESIRAQQRFTAMFAKNRKRSRLGSLAMKSPARTRKPSFA